MIAPTMNPATATSPGQGEPGESTRFAPARISDAVM